MPTHESQTAEQRDARARRVLAIRSHDPIDVLSRRYWPVGDEVADITSICRQLDAAANVGAGAPRP